MKNLIREVVKEVLDELEERKKPKCMVCGVRGNTSAYLHPEFGTIWMHPICQQRLLKKGEAK